MDTQDLPDQEDGLFVLRAFLIWKSLREKNFWNFPFGLMFTSMVIGDFLWR